MPARLELGGPLLCVAWRIGSAAGTGRLVGSWVTRRIGWVRSDSQMRRLCGRILVGSPLYLLTLSLLGVAFATVEHARAAQAWDFSGLVLGAHLGLVFWSLSVLAVLRAVGVLVPGWRLTFGIDAGGYAGLFLASLTRLR